MADLEPHRRHPYCQPLADDRPRPLQLFSGDHRPAPALSPPGGGRLETGARALLDQVLLELDQRSSQKEPETAARRGRIDCLRD